MYPSTASHIGIETLAQAWLGAGATTVSVWNHHRLIQHWPAQVLLDMPDFVMPVRLSQDVYGEMRITGFSAPGWSGWRRRAAQSAPDSGELCVRQQETVEYPHAPTIPGLEIFAASRPCLDVGGDYYDFVHQPTGSLAFSVADISGKGLSAALLMPGMHRALRSSLQATANTTPAMLLTELNDEVYSLFVNTGGFATALLGSYTPDSRCVTYANAGHSPVIHRSAAGEINLLQADSVPLGIIPNSDALERRVTLHPGDIFLVGTDGLAEAKDCHGQMFGYGQLLALVETLAHHSATEMGRRLLKQIRAFTGHAPQCDDYTVMVLKGVG